MERVGGYEAVSQDELFVIVKGVLECAECGSKVDELIAVEELSKAYCQKCFFENTKRFHVNSESDFINICFIRN